MFSQAFDAFAEGLAAARAYVRISSAAKRLSTIEPEVFGGQSGVDAIRDLKEHSLPSASWRVLDHCAAVARGYALYEQMCERLLGDWLRALIAGTKFTDLPDAVREAYRLGLSEMLRMIEHERFEHLTLNGVVTNYHLALSGEPFDVAPEIFTFHQRNLRISELNDLLRKVGIQNCKEWVDGCKMLQEFFGEKSRTFDLAESRLSVFIRYRNDAAHGVTVVDEILGVEQIEDEFEFLLRFGRCIYELVCSKWASLIVERGQAIIVGKNTKNYNDNISIVSCESIELNVGEIVLVRDKSFCRFVEIKSLHEDNQSVHSVVVGRAKLIGLQFSEPIPVRGEVIKMVALDPPPNPA